MDSKILEIFGKIVAYGGSAAAIFYGLLKFFGQKWLDEKFSKRLEEFKRFQNNPETFEINKLFNRISKIHEKEFEVLPTAWQKLQTAYGLVGQMTSPLQSYPDLDRMSSQELKEFLKNSKLLDFQKEELVNENKKVDYYRKKMFWINYNEVAKAIMEFHNYIILNKIFFHKEMFDLFSEIDSRIYESHLLSSELVEHSNSNDVWKTLREANKKLQPLVNKLEEVIQKRLHFEDAI